MYVKTRDAIGKKTSKNSTAFRGQNEVRFTVASDRQRTEALRMVHDAYVARGLMLPHPSGMRITPHHQAVTTEVFVATVDARVVLTASLAIDGERDLPSYEVYPELIDELRRQGLSVAEVFCLAGGGHPAYRTVHLLQGLMWALLEHGESNSVDMALITVHPRHCGFYTKFLDFVQVGDERPHPAVRGSRALACLLDLRNHGRCRRRRIA